MVDKVIWNVPHGYFWEFPIALYFYFTGISAGACHYSSLYTLLGIKKFKPLAYPAALMALLGFLVTPVTLIMDLEQPFRFWYLFIYPNLLSVMTWGTWLLTIYPISLLFYSWLLYNDDKFRKENKFRKLFKAVSISVLPLAIVVHAYTGFVFGVINARGYWYSAIMPLYFLEGAIVSGFSLLLIFSIFKRLWETRNHKETITDDIVQTSRYALSIILWAYPLFIGSHVIMMLTGPQNMRIAGMLALNDPVFIFGDITLGVTVPIFLLTYTRTRKSYVWMCIAALLCLAGVLLNRHSVVHLGQLVPLS